MNPNYLYGNPENSPLTSEYKKSSFSGGNFSGILGSIAGVWGAFQQADQTQKSIDQLLYELRKNKQAIQYEWQKQKAEDELSLWMSGQTVSGGTSASGVIESNRKIVESNIADIERAVNTEIANMKTQSRNNIIGSLINFGGAMFGAVI